MEKLDKVIAGLKGCIACICSNCEYGGEMCTERLLTDALDAIERLREENQDLRKDIEVLTEEVEPVVHARWIVPDDNYPDTCSNCLFEFVWDGDDGYHPKRCPNCGAHMDELLELRTCYCPICDKHFEVRSNESMGNCPDCGHHVVLHREEVAGE